MGYSSNACPRTHLNILLGSNHSDPKHISYYSHYFLYFRQQKNLGKVSPSLWVLTFHPSWPLNSQRVPCLVTKRSVYASCCCTGNCCSTVNSPQGVSLHNVFLVSALLFFPSPHKFSSGMSSANQCFYCEVRWNKKTPFTVKFWIDLQGRHIDLCPLSHKSLFCSYDHPQVKF